MSLLLPNYPHDRGIDYEVHVIFKPSEHPDYVLKGHEPHISQSEWGRIPYEKMKQLRATYTFERTQDISAMTEPVWIGHPKHWERVWRPRDVSASPP